MEDTKRVGFFNRLQAAGDVELSIDVIQVCFYGFRRNEQFDGNFLVLQVLSQQIQDLEFAIRQGLDLWLIANR